VTFLFVILSEAKNPRIFLAVPTTFPRSDKKVTPSERSRSRILRTTQSKDLRLFLPLPLPVLFLPLSLPVLVLAVVVACPFVCHSAAQRRNLLWF
jgi:hypothetical protein